MSCLPDNSPLPFRTVLVTRPLQDARPLVRAIRRRGGTPVSAPMLRISYPDDTGQLAPWLPAMRGLLFTSANGVRAFSRLSQRRDVPVYAVGAATAAQARRAGFTEIATAGGDIASLAALVGHHRAPGDGMLVHVAGSHVAGDLAGLLSTTGFEVRRIVLYHASMALRLPPRAVTALRAPGGTAVLLYSPRTALAFAGLVRGAGAEPALARCAALCLSPAVAAAATGLRWRRVLVAAAPEQKALLEALGQLWRKT